MLNGDRKEVPRSAWPKSNAVDVEAPVDTWNYDTDKAVVSVHSDITIIDGLARTLAEELLGSSCSGHVALKLSV